MIQDLRFVVRDGAKVLQMATSAKVEDGELVYTWLDVPLVAEEPIDSGVR